MPDGTTADEPKVVVRDWLIVGLGDSNGSGQGTRPTSTAVRPQRDAPTSTSSAKYVEDHDPRSSVTFLWASCSGARSDQLWRNTYEGQEPGRARRCRRSSTRSTAGSTASTPEGRRRRDVDRDQRHLLRLDHGFLHDLRHSDQPRATGATCESAKVVVEPDSQGYTGDYAQSFAKGAETLEEITNDRLGELKADYRLLDARLAKLDPAHVFLTQYPDETTDASGDLCDGRSGPPPHLEETVWSFLHKAGADLNRAVSATASLGWTPITGIAADFTGHGYCSPDTYFRTIVASGLSQGNAFGSFHATAAGQAITYSTTAMRSAGRYTGTRPATASRRHRSRPRPAEAPRSRAAPSSYVPAARPR